MRSIPLAMTWEFWQRGKWRFLAAVLASTAFPGILFGVIATEGALALHDPGILNMHVMLMLMNGVGFGFAVMQAQGSLSRLYVLPVSTFALVAGRLPPGMAATVLMSAASTTLLNALLGLGWPIWGPAFFMAVFLAAMQAVLWLTEKSVGEHFAFAFVVTTLGLWYHSRYGAPFSKPTRLWLEVRPGDALVMLAVTVCAFGVAWVGLTRDRCGEAPTSAKVREWAERVFEPAPAAGQPFRSAAAAQFWFEWRQKGHLLPSATAVIMAACLGWWLIYSRVPQELLDGCVLCGVVLLTAGGTVVGVLTGNTGPSDGNSEMGQFLATRPMPDADLAHPILTTAGKNVLISWSLWAVVFLTAYAIIQVSPVLPRPALSNRLEWWYFPATLLGLWTTVTLVALLVLLGHGRLVLIVCIVGISLFVGILLLKYALSREAHLALMRGLRFVVGATFVLGTAAVFITARRRSLIVAKTVYVAFAGWLLLCTQVGIDRSLHPDRPWCDSAFVLGVLALAVAPFAAAPLALAWNRHR